LKTGPESHGATFPRGLKWPVEVSHSPPVTKGWRETALRASKKFFCDEATVNTPIEMLEVRNFETWTRVSQGDVPQGAEMAR
jgi:hypothetical protein